MEAVLAAVSVRGVQAVRTVASCPAEIPCISMVVMGVWPSFRMFPVMVDSNRIMFYSVSRGSTRPPSSKYRAIREHVHKTLVRAVRLHVAEAEAAQVARAC